MQLEDLYKAEWFDAIFKEIAEGVIFTDHHFIIQSINPAALRFLNSPCTEFLTGKHLQEFVHLSVNNDISIESIRNEIQINNSSEKEVCFYIEKGKLSGKIKRVENPDKVVSYIIFLKDFIEEHPEENKFVEKESKYRGLFENIQEGIFILNDNGVIIDANPAACQIYRLNKDNLVGLTVNSIFPHKSSEECELTWKEFLKTGHLEGFYKFEVRKNEVRYIDFKSSANFLPGYHIAVFSDVTEKTKIEKALRISEANLKAIFNNTRQQIILVDPELRIVTFNESAQEVAYSTTGKELIIGEYIYSYLNGGIGDKDKLDPIYERVKTGEAIFIEINPTYFKSQENWFEVGFIPVFDHRNSLKEIVLSINDISSRKKAELNLSESEARFRSLVQNSSDIITILDRETQIKYTSASIEKILGYKEEELNGKELLPFIHEDDRTIVRNALRRISSGEQYNTVLEYKFLHAEGFYVYLETTCNNLLSNEYIEGIVLNTRDITERKYQEENLLLLERAIDSSINGIIISDPNQRDNPVIYANKAFEQISGYNYFDIVGKNCRYLQNDDRNQPEIEKIRNAIENQREVSVVLRNYRKDGTLFWNQLSISPVFNRNGELTNYIGVINDITQKKIAEDALLEITQGISATAENIYSSIVTHIGLRLQVDFVHVSEIVAGADMMRTRSVFKDGEIVGNFEYPLPGSICQKVLDQGSCMHCKDIAGQFPFLERLNSEKLCAFMGVPLKDSTGKIIGVLGLMSRKQIQNVELAESVLNIFSVRVSSEMELDHYIAALKSSEQRFKDLAKNSPDVVYIIDLEVKRITYFNRVEIFGYSAEDLRNSEDWEKIVHEDDVDDVIQHWKQFLEYNNNVTHGVEYRIRNKAGEYEWVYNRHIVLERFPDSSVKQILLNITIITEKKKAEEALREGEARLTALIENTSDILWSVDKDLVFTTMNSSLKRLFANHFGHELEVGQELEKVLPQNLRDEWTLLHREALGGKRFSIEFIIKDKTSELSYEVTYNPIYSEEGFISGVSVFGRDITERKRAENDIIRTNFELDSFVYRASHDLRAPLRSVLGLINLAKLEEDETERNLYLHLVEKSVNKLDTFIADLTNFSRNSRLEISKDKIDFKTIIDDCLENLKYMDNADKVQAVINILAEVDYYSDKTRISIVFQNIISNAIKYLNPRISNSYVSIDIQANSEYVDIIISDNGRGIRAEYLDKIFNMFFRASQESYGSGLGLYITKQVIEKLNGTISVFSELGVGTRFIIRLPNLHK